MIKQFKQQIASLYLGIPHHAYACTLNNCMSISSISSILGYFNIKINNLLADSFFACTTCTLSALLDLCCYVYYCLNVMI